MALALLPDWLAMPLLDVGTRRIGELRRTHAAELFALRLSMEIGYRTSDTVESCSGGGANRIHGKAQGAALLRDELGIDSRVYPPEAAKASVVAGFEGNLNCFKLGHRNPYLLRWCIALSLAQPIGYFGRLLAILLIRLLGIGNFDIGDRQGLMQLTGGDARVGTCRPRSTHRPPRSGRSCNGCSRRRAASVRWAQA
jgi:diketogulonate reductase-like aldo/keto reductase